MIRVMIKQCHFRTGPTITDLYSSRSRLVAGKFGFKKLRILYYQCSKNKDADQLRSYCEADLRLCFRICKMLVFSVILKIIINDWVIKTVHTGSHVYTYLQKTSKIRMSFQSSFNRDNIIMIFQAGLHVSLEIDGIFPSVFRNTFTPSRRKWNEVPKWSGMKTT